MSRLEYYARPLVAFDPANKEHRRHYYEFQRSASWGSCPVRFICPEDHGLDLISMIQHQLLAYYVDKEFRYEKPADAKGIRPKRLTKG